MSQKLENLLNLALDADQGERARFKRFSSF